MKKLFYSIVFCLCLLPLLSVSAKAANPWTPQQANDWYSRQPWLVGSNFIPSTAINELEMWQAETFDLPTIDRELTWAESLGMNTMRVFLHNLLWQDQQGFLARMEQFLRVADKHHIRITFVLLDSVWDPLPKLGKQREPRPHVHNSGWVQAPGAEILRDKSRWKKDLKPYVVGVISHFRNDHRVLMWDLINEPDNGNPAYKSSELSNKAELAFELLKQEWKWAREAKPSQPLTSGVWTGDWSSDAKLTALYRFQLENSDVISFHSYDPPAEMQKRIDSLKRYQRPIICTEYGGPNLFEFPENRPYISLVSTWSQAATTPDKQGSPQSDQHGANRISELYARMPTLPPQTQMFQAIHSWRGHSDH